MRASGSRFGITLCALPRRTIGTCPDRGLFVRKKYGNTVLNRHQAPQKEFHLYGESFWNAAKTLLKNEALDKRPIASFDASVIVYLYRHALELFLKEILIGRGGDLVDPPPSPKTVVEAKHSLTKLLPDVRRIFVECGWDKAFGSKAIVTFDDFEAIVKELEGDDPSSSSFRTRSTSRGPWMVISHLAFASSPKSWTRFSAHSITPATVCPRLRMLRRKRHTNPGANPSKTARRKTARPLTAIPQTTDDPLKVNARHRKSCDSFGDTMIPGGVPKRLDASSPPPVA